MERMKSAAQGVLDFSVGSWSWAVGFIAEHPSITLVIWLASLIASIIFI